MINLCTDPTCDDNAAMTIQRAIDTAPVGFCLRHGYQREAELRQSLQNFTSLVLERPATDLELAQTELAQLTALVEGSAEFEQAKAAQEKIVDLSEQLDRALNTLELQSKSLDTARGALLERDDTIKQVRRELVAARGELERTRQELQWNREQLELVKAKQGNPPAPAGPPETPPPPTRPDGEKP